MLQKLVYGIALLRVLFKAAGDKIAKIITPVTLLKHRRRVVGDVEEDTHLLLVDVGWLTYRQLHQEDAVRPDVHLVVVCVLPEDHLRSHPTNCADFAVPRVVFVIELDSVAKVRQLDVTVHRHKDVVRLDVTVHDFLIVKVLQTLEHSYRYVFAYVLAELVRLCFFFKEGGDRAAI